MSISIKFNNVIKRYGDNTVIPDLSLEIKQGELFTLLGPSGCGKTTLLRMVAGFNSIEGGSIYFNDRLINNVPPKDRNIGMVFQNYAIFPHLTVKKNIAFGLENRKIARKEMEDRISQILKTVQIEQFQDRLPENLSGGQQQRVALARAIVMEPNVLLMDEPLSNLDAKLRIDMRNAIREIQKNVGITTIYVTHDQEEAMAISDRIAIMKDGIIQHVGTPQNIYHRPANVFVASFIGRTNIIRRKFIKSNKELILDNEYKVLMENLDLSLQKEESEVDISIRPEEFTINQDGKGIKAKVISSMFLGLNTNYFLELETGEFVEVIKESSMEEILEVGTIVGLTIKKEKINVFNKENHISITKGVVNNGQL